MTKRNKAAGNKYECDLANELRELGFEVVTSRAESKNMDNKKVDIFSPLGTDPDKTFPFYLQAKFTSANPSYNKLLEEMPKDRAGLVFHKKSESYECKDSKVRHRSTGEFVIMRKQDFYNLLNGKKIIQT